MASELRKAIESAINRYSAENGSNTPDFILSDFLMDCLAAFDKTTVRREQWYGVQLRPGQAHLRAEKTPVFDELAQKQAERLRAIWTRFEDEKLNPQELRDLREVCEIQKRDLMTALATIAELRAEKAPDWRDHTGAPRCKHCGKLEVEHGYRDGINPPCCLGDRTDNTAFDPTPPDAALWRDWFAKNCAEWDQVDNVEQELGREPTPPEPAPVPMLLFCPNCGLKHVDAPEPETGWTNPPHKSHKCHACGCIWRPADVPTDGEVNIRTRGSADTWGATWADGVAKAAPATAPVDPRPKCIRCGERWTPREGEDATRLPCHACMPDDGGPAQPEPARHRWAGGNGEFACTECGVGMVFCRNKAPAPAPSAGEPHPAGCYPPSTVDALRRRVADTETRLSELRDKYDAMTRQRDEAREEQGLTAEELHQTRTALEAARAELERDRHVIEAACAYHAVETHEGKATLLVAVGNYKYGDALRAAQKGHNG